MSGKPILTVDKIIFSLIQFTHGQDSKTKLLI